MSYQHVYQRTLDTDIDVTFARSVSGEVRDLLTRLKHRTRVAIALHEQQPRSRRVRRKSQHAVPMQQSKLTWAQALFADANKRKNSSESHRSPVRRRAKRKRRRYDSSDADPTWYPPSNTQRNSTQRRNNRESTTESDAFRCSLCGRAFTSRRGLCMHISKTHSGVKGTHRRDLHPSAKRPPRQTKRQKSVAARATKRRIAFGVKSAKRDVVRFKPAAKQARYCGSHLCPYTFTERPRWSAHRKATHPAELVGRWSKAPRKT